MFRLARLGRRPGVRRRQPGAFGGARRRSGRARWSRRGPRRRRSARSYYACHPEVFTSAEFVRAVGRAMGRRRPHRAAFRHTLGRALLRLTEAAAATRRADDDPHRGQGQRVLPAGLDRRPGAAHPRHGLARRARPATRAGRDLRLVPERGMAVAVAAAPAGRVGTRLSASAGGPAARRIPGRRLGGRGRPRARRFPTAGGSSLAHALFARAARPAHPPGLGPRRPQLREIYPLLLLVGALQRARRAERAGGVRVHDATVQRWELALFGAQLSREWWRAAPEPLLVGGAPRGVLLLLPHRRRPRRSTSPGGATWPRCAVSCWW